MPTNNVDADTDRLFQLSVPILKKDLVNSLADDYLDWFQGSGDSLCYLSLVVWAGYGAFYLGTLITTFLQFSPCASRCQPIVQSM